MGWFIFGPSKSEKEDFDNFQEKRLPSMSVIGRGTLTMSLDDAHAARKEKIRQQDELLEQVKHGKANY